jgi:imidazole glycerol-phosphate synthase subunit HisH
VNVAVVPTGTANLASVIAAFTRLGARSSVVDEADRLAIADRVVLPGVGSFGAAIDAVDRLGLRTALADRIAEGRPTLAVCVGMQLLASLSEESQGASGLGVIESAVTRFPRGVRVPQLGWNRVEAGAGARLIEDGWAYFANSYRIDEVPEGWIGAATDHGGQFVSAIERGDVLACQFHPELSGEWGSAVLARWLGGAA